MPKAKPTHRLTDMDIGEVSLVDLGANRKKRYLMVKRETDEMKTKTKKNDTTPAPTLSDTPTVSAVKLSAAFKSAVHDALEQALEKIAAIVETLKNATVEESEVEAPQDLVATVKSVADEIIKSVMPFIKAVAPVEPQEHQETPPVTTETARTDELAPDVTTEVLAEELKKTDQLIEHALKVLPQPTQKREDGKLAMLERLCKEQSAQITALKRGEWPGSNALPPDAVRKQGSERDEGFGFDLNEDPKLLEMRRSRRQAR